MLQAGTAMKEFAQEFERCAWDMGIAEEDTKVHLVSALNQDTLTYLDAYITICGSDEIACLETIQD